MDIDTTIPDADGARFDVDTGDEGFDAVDDVYVKVVQAIVVTGKFEFFLERTPVGFAS